MKIKRELLIIGIVIGSLLSLSPIVGLIGTAFGMIRAFRLLGDAGISDPKALSNSIGVTLFTTATGLVLLPIGLVILTLSIVLYAQQRTANPPPLLSKERDCGERK